MVLVMIFLSPLGYCNCVKSGGCSWPFSAKCYVALRGMSSCDNSFYIDYSSSTIDTSLSFYLVLFMLFCLPSSLLQFVKSGGCSWSFSGKC
jgi:hypothetical protein